MTDYDNNRPLARGDRMQRRNDGLSWAVPATLLAIAVIIGGLFYANFNSVDRTAALNNDQTTPITTTPARTTAPTSSTPAPAR